MNKIVAGAFGALILCAAAGPANAVKWVSGGELTGHCRAYVDAPTSLDGIVCVAYVQGFLGGADATDATVEKNVRSQYKERSAYLDRVVRTRLGKRVEQFGPAALADYCLPVEESTTSVVLHVLEYIDAHPEAETLNAQQIVYGALQEHYPCADAE